MDVRSLIDIVRDVWRGLKADRLSTVLAAANMALGIGAAAATLSIVDATLLRPLPYPEAAGIVEISQPDPSTGRTWPFTYRFFLEARGRLPGLENLAALSISDVTLETGGEPVVETAVACSASLFDLLRMSPLRGRFFSAEEEARTPDGSWVILSEELWRGAFGGEDAIVGRKLRLDGKTFEVAGVIPAGMRVPPLSAVPGLWIPLGSDPVLDQLQKMFDTNWDRSAYLSLWGRVSPGLTIAAAQERSKAVALPLLADSDPDHSLETGFRLAPIEQQIRDEYRLEVSVLILATLLVLAVSCANFSNLILAREPSRRMGVSLRFALGESAARIGAVAVLESVAISLIGAAAGAAATIPLFQALESSLPEGLLPVREFSLNGLVTLAVAVIAVVSGLAVSLFPAIRLTRLGFTGLTGSTSRSVSEGRPARNARRLVVVSQTTCAVVSLTLALLLLKTFLGLTSVELGFDARSVLVADLTLPQNLSSGEQWQRLARSLTQAMRPQAGVAAVAAALSAPAARVLRTSYRLDSDPSQEPVGIAEYRPVGPAYFDALKIPLLRGRSFTDQDDSRSSQVCIVNRTLAREQFEDGIAVGSRIAPVGFEPCVIVGVVADVRGRNLRSEPPPAMYVPMQQVPPQVIQGFMSLIVRMRDGSSGAQAYGAGALADTIHQQAPNLPVTVGPLMAVIDGLSALERFRTLLMSAVSLLTMVLVFCGVYGITAGHVSHRRRELAIRLALGTTGNRVLADLVKDALKLTWAGLALGLAIAFPVADAFQRFLVGAGRLTLWDVLLVAGVVALLSFLSSYLPGRRVLGLNPAEALRQV